MTNYGLSRNERILFEQFASVRYLLTHGFQLLADDKLTSEQWQKFRTIAWERTSEIGDAALAKHSKGKGQGR